MTDNSVRSLFKYYPFTQLGLKVLIDRKVWYSCPRSFNDPFDCNMQISQEISDSDFIKFNNRARRHGNLDPLSSQSIEHFIENKDDITKEMIEAIDDLCVGSGVLVLTERNDSVLMWSHYANGHTGFCLEFASSAGGAIVPDQTTHKVEYDDHPEVSLSKLYTLMHKDPNKEFFTLLMATKARDWSYEKEWRKTTFLEEGQSGRLQDYPGNLLSVTFGVKMQMENRRTIRNTLGDAVAYNEVFRRGLSFELSIEPLEGEWWVEE